MPEIPSGLSSILVDYRSGLPGARERLVEAVLDEVRAMARRRLASVRKGPEVLLQPTILANDTLLRLLEQRAPIQNPKQLFALAKRFMGWILIDYQRQAEREPRVSPLSESSSAYPAEDLQENLEVDVLLRVREALQELKAFAPRAAEVVALRTLSGQSIEEVGLALGVGHATVERQYRVGLDWLKKRLGER